MSLPSDTDNEDLLLSCRYGDLGDVQQFVDTFGPAHLTTVRDENGNSILHMIAGNGQTEVLDYILPIISPTLLSARNNSGSTALHWAVLNSHLLVVQKLVQFSAGPGINLIAVKNAAGRSSLGEAEIIGWEEGAEWLAQVMGREGVMEEDGEDGDVNAAHDVHVEVEDADGRMSKMTLGG